MRLYDIALNNLKRRKGKMIFLTVGLIIGITTIVTLLSITSRMSEDLGKKLDEYGANIVVMPKSEGLSLSYGGISLGGVAFDTKDLNADDLEKIKSIKNSRNISILAPEVIGVAEVNEKPVMLVGVDFEKELRLKKWWKKAQSVMMHGEVHSMENNMAKTQEEQNIVLSDLRKKNDVVIGYEAAKRFGLKTGDEFIVNGSSLRIAAVLGEIGSQDDNLIFLDLLLSQKILKKEGKLSMVEVSAYCKDCPVEDIVSQISAKLPHAKVTALKQVVQGRMETLSQFKSFAIGISIVVIFIGSLMVFVTMMSSVNERTREIGIFRAIGYRQSHIMKIILFEAFVVSFLAGVFGFFLGAIISQLISLKMFSTGSFTLGLDYTVAVGSILLSILIGMLASLYPAKRAAKMDPSEALRAL